MRRSVLWVAVACLPLIGCSGNRPAEPSDPGARQVGIGWSRHDWRLCEEEDSCPRPTPKTVLLADPTTSFAKPQSSAQPPIAAEERPAVVHFEFAQASPTEAGTSELEAALARIHQDQVLRIVGHTDDMGTSAFNARLARRRAEFVAVWLKRRGIRNPMHIEAREKCCYVAANDSEQGRAANRRAEIHFSTTHKEIDR